jgi:hypothetical protein
MTDSTRTDAESEEGEAGWRGCHHSHAGGDSAAVSNRLWQTLNACFAGAGWNWFAGQRGYTSWMDYLHTGNNDITYRDCNGALVDYPRGTDTNLGRVSRCISDIGIKPY